HATLVKNQVVLAFAAGHCPVHNDLLVGSPGRSLCAVAGFMHQDGLAAVAEIPGRGRDKTRCRRPRRAFLDGGTTATTDQRCEGKQADESAPLTPAEKESHRKKMSGVRGGRSASRHSPVV